MRVALRYNPLPVLFLSSLLAPSISFGSQQQGGAGIPGSGVYVWHDMQAPAAEQSSSRGGRVFIQAGAFKRLDGACSAVDELNRNGYQAGVFPGSDFHRVFVGPFETSGQASSFLSELHQKGFDGYLRYDLPISAAGQDRGQRSEQFDPESKPESRELAADVCGRQLSGWLTELKAADRSGGGGKFDQTPSTHIERAVRFDPSASMKPDRERQSMPPQEASLPEAIAGKTIAEKAQELPPVPVGKHDPPTQPPAGHYGRESYGDAMRGLQVLKASRCTLCHRIHGDGGGSAPNLTRRSSSYKYSIATLVAMLWNHGPTMSKLAPLAQKGQLAEQDLRDVLCYFYAQRFFDPAGDAARGKRVFAKKGCQRCHPLLTAAAGIGAPATAWVSLSDPVIWTQQMLNHGSAMGERMDRLGIVWTAFTMQQMVDLLVYLENLPGGKPPLRNLQIGNSFSGEQVFRKRGCDDCHTLGKAARAKIDLLNPNQRGRKRSWFRRLITFRWLRGPRRPSIPQGNRTLSGLAVGMWNHASLAQQMGRQRATLRQSLTGGQMGNLVAYLFEQGYFFSTEGNVRRGKRVFRKKRCDFCHSQSPSPTPGSKRASTGLQALQMAAALWSHDPTTISRASQRGVEWPKLTDRNVVDLIEYSRGKILATTFVPKPSPEKGLFVQVGAFRAITAATFLVEELRQKDYAVHSLPGKDFHRVVIGPFLNSMEATATVSRLKSEGYSTYVRQEVPRRNTRLSAR